MTSATLSAPANGLWVPPRYATPRDHSRRTLGGGVGKVAAALGWPLMPWQQYVADVAGEVDDAGLPVYSTILVSVQRQCGKTTLDFATSAHRCLYRPHRRAWHTAQTGQVAREKWRSFTETLEASPLRTSIDAGLTRKGNGDERLVFRNGSQFRPHKPGRDALHGEQSDLNNIDEGWVFDELEGADLLQAITPTQLTRPGAQTFIWSTRGDRSSTWFHGLIDAIRAGAVPRAALFDWGIPDGEDPDDLAVIARHHPAFGHTVTMPALEAARSAFADDPAGWARAYGNIATGNAERVIPLDVWLAARTEAEAPPGRAAYGLAVSGDGAWGAVVAAVLGPDGLPFVEVLEHRPGRSWLVGEARALARAGELVAVDKRGPAAPVADQLDLAAGVEVLTPAGPDIGAACQDFYDRVTDPGGPRLRHRAHHALDDAADVAGRRALHDGGWVWSRTRSTGDTSALEAATLAAWALLRNPAPAPAPFVMFA